MDLTTFKLQSRLLLSALAIVCAPSLIDAKVAQAKAQQYVRMSDDDSVSHAVLSFLSDDKLTILTEDLETKIAQATDLSLIGPEERFGSTYWQTSFNPLDDAHVQKLKQVFQSASKLEKITLANYPASSLLMVSLIDMLKSSPRLEALSLYHIVQYQQGFDEVVSGLPNLTALKDLALGADDYPESLWLPLSEALSQMSQLENLDLFDLGDVALQRDHALIMFSGLSKLNKLQSLNLSGTGYGPSMAEPLSTILKSNPCLAHLNVAALNLGDDGLMRLLPALTSAPSLQEINLRHNGATASVGALVHDAFLKRPEIKVQL